MEPARQEDLDALQMMFEAEVAALKERLRVLEAGMQPATAIAKVQPTSIEEGNPEPVDTPECKELTLAVLIQDAEEQGIGYQLQAKAWDAALFVGTGAMGPIGSLFATITLAMNVFGQVLFLQILRFSRSFLESSPPSNDSLALWRVHSGHSFATEKGGSSLVSHVCQLDDSVSVATTQKDLVSDAKEYLNTSIMNGTALGPLLCMFCLVLWMLTVIVHLREIFSFMMSLFLLRSRKTNLQRLKDGSISVTSISSRRCVVLLLLTALRGVIIVLLLILGSLWLARTGGVGDILLNAVSLAFVLDLDELLFGALAPDTAQVLVTKSKPLPGLRPRHWHGIGPRPVGYLLACSLLLLFMGVTDIRETKETMIGINETICGGRQEVIIDIGPSSKRVLVAPAEPWQPRLVKDFSPLDRLVHNLIWEKRSWSEASLQKARSYASIPIQELAGLYECVDSDMLIEMHEDVFMYLTNNLTATYKTCADLREFCGSPYLDQLRMFCPLTCGCDSPYIGVDRHGCPPTCRQTQRYTSEMHSIPCEDTLPGEFAVMPNWENMSHWTAWWNISIDNCSRAAPWFCLPYSITLLPSWRYYCPKTCGCAGGGEECPPSCSKLS